MGDVLSIQLSGSRLAFAWVLPDPLMAFFDFWSYAPPPPVEEIVVRPVAFRIWVMKYAVTAGLWPVIGHVPVPQALMEPPEFFKQDALSGRLSIYRTGEAERPASHEECSRLERAAVWDPQHVVDRLEDHFAGRLNKWVESMRVRTLLD